MSNEYEKASAEDLKRIEELFRRARPDSRVIHESADNVVLEHIKARGREIRRARKIVRIFPRRKWAMAAAMGVLVCAVSLSIFFRSKMSENAALKESAAITHASLSEDVDGNGRVDIIDAYIMHRKLALNVPVPDDLDLNGDGKTDQADMKIIAHRSVSLERRVS